MAELRVDGLSKVYASGLKALADVSVTVGDSTMLAVVGPSGCGKSTLLRCVAGLEKISGGDIRLGDRSIAQLRPDERDIAMVFQNYALYPHMSVFDNIAYGLRNRKVGAAQIKQRIDQTAALLRIDHLLDRRPSQLSGGQRQRVAMGRAIARRPRVFLFDEPLSNLDAKLRAHMRIEIKELQRREKVTSMFVTHDQVEAMSLGDRILLLNEGRIEQAGTPDELFFRPASTYVASFVGTPAMNMLPATVDAGQAQVAGFAARIQADGIPSGEVLAGIRPQNVEAADHAEAQCRMQVGTVEHLGDLLLVHGSLADGSSFTVQLPFRGQSVTADHKLNLRVEPGTLHFFHKDTGKRIGAH